MIACSINERLQKALDYKSEEVVILIDGNPLLAWNQHHRAITVSPTLGYVHSFG
jgi:hypothetical protein